MLRRALFRLSASPLLGNRPLTETDAEMAAIIAGEYKRQAGGLELIASENFTSRAVMDCLGSPLTNKYAEGYPGQRYYGGSEFVDKVERLCQQRALEAYKLNAAEWGVNVQPYSGSPANMAVYTALLNPHDRIMGLALPSGGHLTHGFYTKAPKGEAGHKAISASARYFAPLPYHVNKDGLVDFAELEAKANEYRPKLIIAGGSAYTRDWDYARYRSICDSVGALFMVDMAHFSGFVATGEHTSPFAFADVVTSTTHKTLRGPRSGLIFAKAGLMDKINQAVFPGLQGGPHMHQIAAVATQLKEVMSPEFKTYIRQVRSNCQAMAEGLKGHGYDLVGNGTENHLLLWNLKKSGVSGAKMQSLFDAVDITTNMNTVPGDTAALNPSGLRLGSPALTSRGLVENDFKTVADFLHRGVEIGVSLNSGDMKKKDFEAKLKGDAKIEALKKDVVAFATSFPMPGTADPFPNGKQ